MTEHSTPPTTPPQPVRADESPTLAPREQLSGTQADAGQELTAGSPLKLPRMLGRYELRRLLGKGGMGAVYLAHDTQLDRPVALKIPSFASSGTLARERFVQEARAAALVSHPNLCPVYDAGAIDGVEYLTMAYIEGKPLSALIRGGKQLPERIAAALVFQLARAMQAAHERGIIHRDLKPDNIMITVKKQPVIMDFGLARRSVGIEDVRLTQSGTLLGTPAYMSPEQVDGNVKAMGPGCDIYSLGVILYQLLTGRLPFDPAAGFGSLIAQIVTDPPPPPSRFRPGLSAKLERICLTALAKKPEQRQQSMADLACELDSFIRSPQTESKSSTKEKPTRQEPATYIFADMVQTEGIAPTRTRAATRLRPQKRRWAWRVGGGVVAAIVLAVLIAVLVRPPKYGTVRIALSNPRAAVEVRIDGQRVEQDALHQPLSLTPGEHELTVRGPAFENLVQPFSLHAGQE
ncbi:MAG TPA: protein kinase, partial [Gemmataceae bacterium]|nr:protein kinase [Gemmataceae bacterium]